MEVKRDILWRVYLCFIGIAGLGLAVLGKAVYIQRAQGTYWRGMSDSLHQKFVELDAERGTIYSGDSTMLSTSVPYFNIYIDFGADGLREKNGRRFTENLDSLSHCLAGLFADRPAAAYRRELTRGYREEDRYYLLHASLPFEKYQQLRHFPLVREGRNKSGFIAEVINKRLNPFGLLANRTIGLARANAQNVGLERTYDTVLKGQSGRRLVRYIAGGTYVPVEGYEIEAENGKDIVTTLDVNIQDIAENALLKELTVNEADHGTCMVMETATGKIKAIANLGRQPDGTYWEDYNYAIKATEPGSTFKLATLISLLEDRKIQLTDNVDLEKGVWKIAGRTVYDAEKHGQDNVSVKKAFELSSNVGMAKLAYAHYASNPAQFVGHLRMLHLDKATGIDLLGEANPVIKSPGSKTWSATTLPWMAFGYEVLVSPLQTLTLYNAVANNGRMMKPYLVESENESGMAVQTNEPVALMEHICNDATLRQLQECLEGVCQEKPGTAVDLFKNSFYKVAGKTGTALVANRNRGYADHIYQSTFVGYFPAAAPKFTCIVVIKNKPFAKVYYGAKVAGPVFKEVADRLMSSAPEPTPLQEFKRDSARFYYAASPADIQEVSSTLGISVLSGTQQEWGVRPTVPDVRGMGLKDALYLLEGLNLKVSAKGIGKVRSQSIEPGSTAKKNENIFIQLEL
jgi:cell division protein FtsI (penicillin-binding protein 3)